MKEKIYSLIQREAIDRPRWIFIIFLQWFFYFLSMLSSGDALMVTLKLFNFGHVHWISLIGIKALESLVFGPLIYLIMGGFTHFIVRLSKGDKGFWGTANIILITHIPVIISMVVIACLGLFLFGIDYIRHGGTGLLYTGLEISLTLLSTIGSLMICAKALVVLKHIDLKRCLIVCIVLSILFSIIISGLVIGVYMMLDIPRAASFGL